jgi:hypothetical protein
VIEQQYASNRPTNLTKNNQDDSTRNLKTDGYTAEPACVSAQDHFRVAKPAQAK